VFIFDSISGVSIASDACGINSSTDNDKVRVIRTPIDNDSPTQSSISGSSQGFLFGSFYRTIVFGSWSFDPGIIINDRPRFDSTLWTILPINIALVAPHEQLLQ
jgi:hypothetical protein